MAQHAQSISLIVNNLLTKRVLKQQSTCPDHKERYKSLTPVYWTTLKTKAKFMDIAL